MNLLRTLIFLSLLNVIGFAQGKKLLFYPIFNDQMIPPGGGTTYWISKTDTVTIETLRFYISNVELLSKNKVIWKETNSYHLLDITKPMSFLVKLKTPPGITFTQLKFTLGIDSVTNVSGALGGDLDPTKGMYWTWQSGYVNFKLEGKSNLCKTRNNAFQFHLGGYQSPFKACREVILDVIDKEGAEIYFDIARLFWGLDLNKQNEIMSPCKEAVELSDKLVKGFRSTE